MDWFSSSDRYLSGPKGRRPLRQDSLEPYQCPVCRYGQVTPMVMMDTFACNFCRHILEISPEQQTARVVDSNHPMIWQWTGKGWKALHRGNPDADFLLWLIGITLLIVPAGLVALAAYIFPPLEGSPGGQLPFVWAIGTLIVHFGIVAWLIAEYYQIPLYVASKVWLQRR